MQKDTWLRSGVKSIIWRICGVIILGAITYAFTRNWIQTGIITILHHSIFLIVFTVHEQAWQKIKKPTSMMWRSIAKMFTYETLLGNIILGTITYVITGDVKQMTQVTLTYIGIKHIVYVLNEFVWKRKPLLRRENVS